MQTFTHESAREKCCPLAHGLCLELLKKKKKETFSLQESHKNKM